MSSHLIRIILIIQPQIYTTLSPFPELPNDAAVILHVVIEEKCPMRPVGIPELGDGMWRVMEACWSGNPALRPNASEVLDWVTKTLAGRRRSWLVNHVESKTLPQLPALDQLPVAG